MRNSTSLAMLEALDTTAGPRWNDTRVCMHVPEVGRSYVRVMKAAIALRSAGLDVGIVDIERDRGFVARQRCQRANAADVRKRLGSVCGLDEPGYQLRQRHNVSDARIAHLGPAKGLDVDRHSLNVFLAPVGCDNDFLEAGVIGLGCGALGR